MKSVFFRMKLLLYVMTGFVAVSSFTSCSKYLDVQPEDLFLEGYVFSSPSEVRKALNGVYISMAKTDLYGLNLTSGTVDVLGQYYNCGHWDHSYNLVQLYEYDRKEVQSKFTAIWDAGYATLLNINNIIVQLEAGKGGLRDDEKAIILGEAYGLRAFISFDLLRLFGPQLTVAADELAMPYPTEPKPMIHTIFSGSEVMEKVLHDMNVAHELLQKDPILEQGVAETDVNGNQFMGRRNRRMNAFAIKALEARVMLYMGEKEKAKQAALEVIDEASSFFPWTTASLTAQGIANPDRVFSSEVIFGLDNPKLYDIHKNNFAAVLKEKSLLMPLPARLNDIYEGLTNDYRFRTWFVVDPLSTRSERVFMKYADIENSALQRRHLQPLVKISEMYFIAAECETDRETAISHMNMVRTKRGTPVLSGQSNFSDLLEREYQKEFWGEGQLFFFYKRLNYMSIKSGAVSNTTISMVESIVFLFHSQKHNQGKF